MRNLFWFRSDLRIQDNKALIEAVQHSSEVIALFILTPKTWQSHQAAPIKIQFLLNNLTYLSQELSKLGIPLLIRETDYYSDCPKVLRELCQQLKIKALYFNKQYEFDECRRDAKVIDVLNKDNINCYHFDDEVVLAPGTVLSQQKTPLKIFTPYKKAWILVAIKSSAWKAQSFSQKKFKQTVLVDPIPAKLKGFEYSGSLLAWPAGERAAQKQLAAFIEDKLDRYHEERNYPAANGTSQLSPYLNLGILSVRQCLLMMTQALQLDRLEQLESYPGASVWLSELIWREFYKHILFLFPRVSRNQPFRLETKKIIWRYNENYFKAWCEGRTGFPLIDAAMRQLNETGWMHNRLRMLTANFLTKTLFLNWQMGEAYFMQHLIDGDLAANNGGWQWSASTGTDAAPYFRIFNPILQSQKFDPKGEFIRQFCPELKDLNDRDIHEPYRYAPAVAKKNGYPLPLLPLRQHRLEVLEAFKSLKA